MQHLPRRSHVLQIAIADVCAAIQANARLRDWDRLVELVAAARVLLHDPWCTPMEGTYTWHRLRLTFAQLADGVPPPPADADARVEVHVRLALRNADDELRRYEARRLLAMTERGEHGDHEEGETRGSA